MDSLLTSKALVRAHIDSITLALSRDEIEDAETLLASLRAMRPQTTEFDIFEAWIGIKRGAFDDAMRILRATSADHPVGGAQVKALMAFCQFASGNNQWSDIATQVLEGDADEDSRRLMDLLMHPVSAVSGARDEAAATASTPADAPAAPQTGYLRA